MKYLIILHLLLININWSDSVWLDDNGGYRNIILAVDPNLEISNCQDLRKKLEILGGAFSKSLYGATSGKLHVASIDVVLAEGSSSPSCEATEATQRQSWSTADIQLSTDWHPHQKWNPIGSRGVGVQQPWGCGRPGDKILLSYSSLKNINQSQGFSGEHTQIMGHSLVASWARYRWGIFEETPLQSTETAAKSCGSNCTEDLLPSDSSIMKDLRSSNTTFCTSTTHDGLSRNKQNLACKGLSSLDIMKRHSDFREDFQTLAQKYLSKNEYRLRGHKVQSTAAPKRSLRHRRNAKEDHVTPEEAPKYFSYIGTLPPTSAEVETPKRSKKASKMLKSDPSKINYIESLNLMNATRSPVAWITPATPPSSVTWVRKNQEGNASSPIEDSSVPVPKIRFVVPPPKAIVVALDLSSSSVAQASVEWLRGGLLRWMFGVGVGVRLGVLAAYSNTSFPLSPGPLTKGPITAEQLEERMTLLPFQHEVDDEVYGGKYCLACVINETQKMFSDSGIPLEAGVLVLTVCEPQLSSMQMRQIVDSPITIHTVTMCPNAPLYIEKLTTSGGRSWAITSSTALGAETQLGHLLNSITDETLLSPADLRLSTIHEQDHYLDKSQVERIGAYRRVGDRIPVQRSNRTRLFILTSSIPAKVAEVRVGGQKVVLHRDTTRRYWSLLNNDADTIEYSLLFLSTSLEFPLSIATGIYEQTPLTGVHITLATNTKRYYPGNALDPYLVVTAHVTKDGRPIRNAHVVLSATYLSGQSPATYSLMLLDNGSTEPDIREGDGFYSRYLTWTPGTGRYILTASVASTKASVTDTFEASETVPRSTGDFSLESSSLSLVVEMVPPGDFFPPSRVTDLNVTPLSDSLVNVTWSAPGGDLDQGSAWRYQLKMYTESSGLSPGRFESSGIDVYCIQGEERAPTPAPALFGTKQHCVAEIPFANLHWFFAMKATDGANNSGEISNVASVFVAEKSTKPPPSPSGTLIVEGAPQTVLMSTVDPVVAASEDGDTWRLYGIALVGAVGLVMLAVAAFAVVLCCRRRAKAVAELDRPIYKIYVNNAYIQEEDGEVKVIDKEKGLAHKEHTQQWVNSLDKYPLPGDTKESPGDVSCDTIGSKSPGPPRVRFGVLTNGSLMPSSSSSASSRPSDEALHDDFRYKDLSSETTSDSTLEGPCDNLRVDDLPASFQPLGIPPLRPPHDSDDDGGFRTRRPHFSSFRQVPMTEVPQHPPFSSVSRASNVALPHGTVRSVKKRRHISFV